MKRKWVSLRTTEQEAEMPPWSIRSGLPPLVQAIAVPSFNEERLRECDGFFLP